MSFELITIVPATKENTTTAQLLLAAINTAVVSFIYL